ncbi:GTP binding protein bud4 [Lasiodiplodia theobromae]|uniref:GTP binding protein bud4 n=1 Tax=Lasiodiplodia theobromae TaxID=45133 RepID=UPI0015C33C6E|nr:GTP binding protein bud4 [Lasiodiplodia theobromae]KAF4538750.1 GTP binding protein bud4 [Lasiodiplodia theobromae]
MGRETHRRQVRPLRINKNSPTSSPAKMSSTGPLSEISPMEHRRNSPSHKLATKITVPGQDTPPSETSPFGTSSKHRFWQSRDPNSPDVENSFEREQQTLSPKRSSIENLMKASRVRNSTMFAREQKNEYDPTKLPIVERPLASNRPLSAQGFVPRGFDPLRNRDIPSKKHQHSRSDSADTTPRGSPSKFDGSYMTNSSPTKTHASPLRSSLSRNGRYSTSYDNDSSVLSSDDERVGEGPQRPLRRHAKSVTFESKPPVVNEYEMVTPEPSLASREGSDYSDDDDEEDYEFEGDSMERDDSFDESLEDTEKTPVVLPGDWRHMSPEAANTDLANTFEDPFEGAESSPPPSAMPNSQRTEHVRNHSTASDPEQRPLPPLPPMQGSPDSRGRRESLNGLSAAAERASSAHRSLPSPPRIGASISKSDILSMGRNSPMSLEDRLQLMGIHGSREPTPTMDNRDEVSKEADHERKDSQDALKVEDPAEDNESALDEMDIPHISRESILEKVKSRNYDDYDIGEQPSMTSEHNYGEIGMYDPDVPIPSREVSSNFDENVPDEPAHVKKEDGEVTLDFNAIPDLNSAQGSPANNDGNDDEDDDNYSDAGSVIRHDISGTEVDEYDDDDASRYSTPHDEIEEKQVHNNSTDEDDGPPTPKAEDRAASDEARQKEHQKVADMPEFGSFNNEEDFHLQLQSYLDKNRSTSAMDSGPKLEPDEDFLQRPLTPDDELEPPKALDAEDEDGRDTPDSAIRNPIEPPEREDSAEVEDPIATIKAPGGSLRTRPSATPSDFATMAATRRKVSGEAPPPMVDRSPTRLSMTREDDDEEEPSHLSHVSEEQESTTDDETKSEGDQPRRRPSFRMQIDLPVGDIGEDLSFDLDREFDRVVEAQKKGYLMRQNTKVVVASSRQFSSETTNVPSAESLAPPPTNDRGVVPAPGNRSGSGSSSKKNHRDRSNTWTTEPWNGQESAVADNFGDMSMIDESDENMERGRLFVKVVGVKDLDLPLPKNERTWFQLTLDNGLHCVTTAWLDLARSAPIGQEFELVVLNDLEFQLTLQTKLTPPPKPKVTAPPPAPAKPTGHKKSNSAFGRLLTSPKKRKEMERKQQEEAERAAALKAQEEREAARRAKANPTAWDLLHDLVAPDGSFARAYVCLKNHERQAYGRPFTIDVPCFNEWALEDAEIANSVKSKRGGPVRRPPYKVGKLTLQLLYVPKPKGATDDDMPKSMNACIREMKEAEETKGRVWEGHLSQQGGDCPYWRRRFFRLSGSKLTAYHETTRQPRATINLAKAAKLIDDRTTLVHNKDGGRRKSGFAEEDEGYAFVEEGFRIRFGNGETIDFYADSADQKDAWMQVLSEVVGKSTMSSSAKAWTELVFRKEKEERAAIRAQEKAAAVAQQEGEQSKFDPTHPTRPGMYDRETTNSDPSINTKRYHRRSEVPPPPIDKSPRHHAIATAPRASSRRGEVKSMIF